VEIPLHRRFPGTLDRSPDVGVHTSGFTCSKRQITGGRGFVKAGRMSEVDVHNPNNLKLQHERCAELLPEIHGLVHRSQSTPPEKKSTQHVGRAYYPIWGALQLAGEQR
jgi:hypothetical protein